MEGTSGRLPYSKARKPRGTEAFDYPAYSRYDRGSGEDIQRLKYIDNQEKVFVRMESNIVG